MVFIFSIPVLIRHLWKLKTIAFMQRCLLCAVFIGPNFLLLSTCALALKTTTEANVCIYNNFQTFWIWDTCHWDMMSIENFTKWQHHLTLSPDVQIQGRPLGERRRTQGTQERLQLLMNALKQYISLKSVIYIYGFIFKPCKVAWDTFNVLQKQYYFANWHFFIFLAGKTLAKGFQGSLTEGEG